MQGPATRRKHDVPHRPFAADAVPPPAPIRPGRMSIAAPIVSAAPKLRLEPRLAYAGSGIERAAFRRDDAAALAALAGHERAGFYVVAGEIVGLKKPVEEADPLFSLAEARALGDARETVFLGLLGEAPRFGVGFDP